MSLPGKYVPLMAAVVAAALWLAPAPASAAASASASASGPVPCKDGTMAAHGGRGACRGHGGINRAAMQGSSTSTTATTTSASPSTAQTAAAATAAPVLCKDGSTAAHGGRGACRGHGGINRSAGATGVGGASTAATMGGTENGAAATANPMSASSAPAGRTRLASAERQSATPRSEPAPGGGPGMVWANSQSKVYHCQSDRWYGRTQQGQYMTEAQAKAQGYRPDHNKPCQ